LCAVDEDGPGHERTALRLGGSKRPEFILNSPPGLKADLKFAADSARSSHGTIDELFPATHPFGSIFQPESARDREINTVRPAVGVHTFNATRARPTGQASAVGPRQ